MMIKFGTPDEFGAVALTATLITLLAILALSGGLYFSVIRATVAVRQAERSEQAYLAAESGVEDIVLRHVDFTKQLPGVGSSLLAVNGATVTTTFSGTGTITITGDGDASGNRRVSQAVLIEDIEGVQFSYALQAGNGGFFMENNSQIIGTIFSNGDVVGNNSPTVTGDVWVVGTGFIDTVDVGADVHAYDISNINVAGSAFAVNQIDNVTISGDGRADILLNSSIASDAYYFTSITGTSVGGSTFPGAPPPMQIASAPYPISDQQLDAWQEEAQEGGTWSGACPLELSGSDALSIGPIVIPCDLRVSNSAVLTLTGKVWVQGDFEMLNNSVIELDSSFGSNDGVFIAYDSANSSTKGVIQIDNNSIIRGSGDPDSFIVLISRNDSFSTGGSNAAIILKNGTASGILFAPDGELFIQNNAHLFEATAWRLHLINNAVVEYQSGLADLNFSSGPTGGWQLRSWQEIQ